MKPQLALLIALLAPDRPYPAVKPVIQYTLRVDSVDLTGWAVEIRLRNMPDSFRLAMAAHPEYDDRYWRYVRDVSVEPSSATVSRADSAVWQVIAPRGEVLVRYRIALPPPVPLPRAAWRPFLTPTGGLLGGPHAFMYVLGAEDSSTLVTLDLPASWEIASGLTRTADPHTFIAASADALIDSPILAGRLHQTTLDLIIRDATRGRRSMDDVMRLLFDRSSGSRGIDGNSIENAVEATCGCNRQDGTETSIDEHARLEGEDVLPGFSCVLAAIL